MPTGDKSTMNAKPAANLPPLPEPPNTPKHYEVVVVHGGIAYVAGQVSRAPHRIVTGHLKKGDDISEAQEAARVSARRCLSALEQALGSLDRIERLLSVRGFVSAEPDFDGHAFVMDAASVLFQEYLGERGKHVRTSVGVASIPANGLTEIEVVAAIREG